MKWRGRGGTATCPRYWNDEEEIDDMMPALRNLGPEDVHLLGNYPDPTRENWENPGKREVSLYHASYPLPGLLRQEELHRYNYQVRQMDRAREYLFILFLSVDRAFCA